MWSVLVLILVPLLLGGVMPPSRAVGQSNDAAAAASPAASAAAVVAFWTAERLAAAKPAPMPMVTRAAGTRSSTAAIGAAMYVPPSPPGQVPTTGAVAGVVGAAGVAPAVTYYTYPYPFTRTGNYPFTLYNGPLGVLGIFPCIIHTRHS